MDVIGDQFTQDLRHGECRSHCPGFAVAQSRHGVEAMSHLSDAVSSCSLHLLIASSSMSRRDSNTTFHAFVDQPEILVKLRRQSKQPDHAASKELQRLLSFCPADKPDILCAAACRVDVRSLQVDAKQCC